MPIQLSGSLVITGSITTTGVITMSGSIASASYSSNSDLLQGTGSVGFATTASFNAVSSSQQQVSASYIALSASYNTFSGSASTRITVDSASLLQVSSSQQQISASLLNVIAIGATTGSNSFRANQSITGSLVVSSTITAQTLVVQTVTSSIVYSSGSNNFGNQLANTQTFTGSVNITGSLTVNTTGTEFQVTNNGIVMGNLLADAHSVTGSLRVTGSTTIFGNLGVGITAGTNGAKLISAGGTTSFFDAAGSRGISIYPSSAGNIHQITSDYIAQSYYSIAITARGTNSDLFISASGNIGIGTTAPNRLLDVSSGGDTYLRVTGNRGNSDDLHVSNVEFYNSNSTRIIAEIRAITGTGGTQSNSGQLAFYTNCAGTYAERLRITSGGLVNILSDSTNTTFTNSGTLAIKNAASEPFMSWHSNTGTRLGFIQMQSAGTAYFSVQVAQALAFDTSGTERMRITACGTVKTQCNQALGALETCGTIANNNCVSLNLNSAGGNGSIGFIAIGATRTDTTACQAVRLFSQSHTNGYNTYTSIQGTNDGGITITNNANGGEIIYNCSGATVNYVVRYINLISINSIFERQ